MKPILFHILRFRDGNRNDFAIEFKKHDDSDKEINMRKKLFAVCLFSFALSLFSQEKAAERIVLKNDLLSVAGTENGTIIYYDAKGSGFFNSILQVHWSYFQHQSKDLRQSKIGENGVRYAGSFANIKFASRVTLQNNRAETEYQIFLTDDNPFAASRQWEITPNLNMNLLEKMGNLRYEYVTMDDKTVSGNLSEMIAFPEKIRKFTILNYNGNDLILEFPGGAKGLERRKEKKPEGIWFFVPAVTEDGAFPQKAGQQAMLSFFFEVRKISAGEK